MESIVDLVVPWLVGGVALCVLSAFALSPLMLVTGIYAWLGTGKARQDADQIDQLLELFAVADKLTALSETKKPDDMSQRASLRFAAERQALRKPLAR